MRKRLRNEKRNSPYRLDRDSYMRFSGCLESSTSEAYQNWLKQLPTYLRSIVEEELIAREAAAKKQNSIQ
jgi:hypothetical protein